MPVLLRRLAAIAVLALGALVVGVLLLRAMGAQVALGPLASPTPLPTAPLAPITVPSGGAAPSGRPPTFSQIEAQVRARRGLPAPHIGAPRLISRAELGRELRAQLQIDDPPARQAAETATLRAMGLLTATQEIGALRLKLLTGQVVGFYDDRARRMAIVGEAGLTPQVQMTYAHEYTHALQDAAFRLSSLDLNARGADDRDLARLSLVEGDATTSMTLWALDHLTPQQLAAVGRGGAPDLAGIPAWMVRQLAFPYTAGANFVARLYASGGFAAVDAAFRQPPISTEQVIHYDKYVANEKPVAVSLPAVAAMLGSGWTEASSSAEGEATIDIWLTGLGAEAGAASLAAQGWGGDRLMVDTGPAGSFALAWKLTWDSPADAREFRQTYAAVESRLAFPSQLISLGDRTVLVAHASSKEILRRVVAAVR